MFETVLARPDWIRTSGLQSRSHSIQLSYGRIFGCRYSFIYYTTFMANVKKIFCFQIVKKVDKLVNLL